MRKRLSVLLLFVILLGSFGAAQADWRSQEITLSYASWADAELEDAMLEKFMEKYPNITVTRDASVTWPWDETMAAAASAGTMPDVFYVFNIPNAVQNEWVRPLDDLWAQDADAALVYEDTGETAVYHGVRYAAPSFMFAQGVWVNKTIFEDYNVELPGYDWTLDDMVSLAKEISDPANHIYGMTDNNIFEHWPAVMNHDYGWNTWDGEKFNFTDPLWTDAYNTLLEFRRLNVIEQMTPEEKMEVLGDEHAWPLIQGRVAMAIDMSWSLATLRKDMADLGTGEMDFYPYPAGPEGHRTYVVPDYIGISSVTDHPEAAFELMKWMTFGRQGMLARFDVIDELGKEIGGLPVANYPEVWDIFLERLPVPGFAAVIDTLDNTFSDVFKYLPGIDQFHQWLDAEEVWVRLIEGRVSAADMALEMEQRGTQIVQEALKRLQ